MRRAFAITLALLLAAAAVVWVLVDETLRGGRLLLPAWMPQPLSAWRALPHANAQVNDLAVLQVPVKLVLQMASAAVSAMMLFGGLILNQSARILEIRRRSISRATAAMTFASLALMFSLILTVSLALRLGLLPPQSDSHLHLLRGSLALAAGGLALGVLAVFAVMKHTFHTTTGKALFLVVSYRFACVCSLATLGFIAWAALALGVADYLERFTRMG